MVNKQKLYSIALVSLAMILMLISIVDAAPYAYITNNGSDTAFVIDTATHEVITRIDAVNGTSGIAVSPDGSLVYMASKDGPGNVYVYNIQYSPSSPSFSTTIPVGANVQGIAVTQDGTNVYMATANGTNPGKVYIWDNVASVLKSPVTVGSNPIGIVVTPDQSKVYVASSGYNSVYVINAFTQTTTTVPVGSQPHGIAVTPDGSKVYVTNQGSNNVSVVNTTTNQVIARLPVGSQPYGIAVTPDGTKAYVANSGSNNVSVVNTTTNQVIATVPVGSGPRGVAVTPYGAEAYVTNYGSNNVSVIDTTTNTVTATVAVGPNPFSLGNFIGGPINPIANFSASPTVSDPKTVEFTDQSIGDVGVSTYQYRTWSFGDGDYTQTPIKVNPSHTYRTPGNYSVNLLIPNNWGYDSVTKFLTIV